MTVTHAPPGPAPRFVRSPVFVAVFLGSVCALIPILWLEVFLTAPLLAIPAWGGLVVAAFVLARGGVLRPMRAILVGLAIGILAPGARYVLTQLDAIESIQDRDWLDQNFAARAEQLREASDYEARKEEIEAEIDRVRSSKDRLKEDGDWILGIAYAFFCPLLLGLIAAVYDFFRQWRQRRDARGEPGTGAAR